MSLNNGNPSDGIASIQAAVQQAMNMYIGDPVPMTLTDGSNPNSHWSQDSNGQLIWTTGGISWNPSTGTVSMAQTHTTPKVGDISYQVEKAALCIYDGDAWKPLIKIESLAEMYKEFHENAQKEVKDMTRFLNLELDDNEELPQAIQDELLVQAFRLKIHRLIQSAKEDKDGTKISNNSNGESDKGNP